VRKARRINRRKQNVVHTPLEGSSILIADDEPSIRDLLRDVLEPFGVRVYLACTGQEALSMIEKYRLDLAILDINMPKLDGLSLLRQLREAGNPIPVVIITAHDISLHQQPTPASIADYITKPFDPGRVLSTIERTLGHRAA
jgi:CheY-like chemotaxis protein